MVVLHKSIFHPGVVLCATLVLTGCNSASQQPAPRASSPPVATYQNVPAGVTPSSFRLPSGSGCKGDIARWNAIQNNDLRSGHVTASVFKTIQGEIAAARAACDAGQDAKASAMVRSSKVRHGYPAG